MTLRIYNINLMLTPTENQTANQQQTSQISQSASNNLEPLSELDEYSTRSDIRPNSTKFKGAFTLGGNLRMRSSRNACLPLPNCADS